ncbi:cysteine proteinase [Hypomontagnella monticulosa]|nr:cysteine proteinase [Hypomontagnella monticulosa]
MMATAPEEMGVLPVSPISNDSPDTGVRRSSRTKKAPAKYDEEQVIPAYEASGQPTTTRKSRPKRKAAQIAEENIEPEDAAGLLDDVLSRMTQDERKEYGGWVELESEPGFFNAMLQEMGAKDFKVQEVYSLDPDILGFLPQPVHGLVFLFEYEGSDEPDDEEKRQSCPDDLWFANQTTANACATVALMNIVMNAQGMSLGTQLQKFRNSTMALPPPHRGHLLDTNDFIRSIHNSVARRIDLISEDLALDNKYEESRKKRKVTKTSSRSSRASRKQPVVDTSYHYVAYVPAGGQVWELDGLHFKPLCLGPATDSWLETASVAIQERMMRNSEFSSFSLLAIGQSPLKTLASELATSIACSRALHELYSGNTFWSVPDPFKTFANYRTAQQGLTHETITALGLPQSFVDKMSHPDFIPKEALKLAEELKTEQESLDAQYVAELATVDDTVEMIRSRQRDYTPAVHQWVRVLAEKGVLRQLIQEMD